MSGTALNNWALSASPNHINEAHALAKKWNTPQENVTGLVEIFKSASTKQILEAISTSLDPMLAIEYGPVVESKH